MKRSIRKIINIILLASILVSSVSITAFAKPAWPVPDQEVQSEGAILVDAKSGAVLYGKNIHEPYYPASITKILTALVVIENCDDLDAELTFSRRAIFDVESGSSNAGYGVGDTITVRTALYAMLLQSANEAANALAEYVAGSFEGFCAMMNMRAKELGCRDSHFANPSGLNNENHYTSAYDFALICRAAFNNETFLQIDGSSYVKLPPNSTYDEPFTVYAHHSMLKRSNKLYYDGIIGGKTGYTSLAGNTLVTCAEREGLRLITVILNGHQTHYEDTKLLLDFGYDKFKSVNLSESAINNSDIYKNLDITGEGIKGSDVIGLDPNGCITLPMNAGLNDVDSEITYELDEEAPLDAIARIDYTYDDRKVGYTYLRRDYTKSVTEVAISRSELASLNNPSSKVEEYVRESTTWEKVAIGLIIAVFFLILALIVVAIVRRSRRSRGFGSLSKSKNRKKRKS